MDRASLNAICQGDMLGRGAKKGKIASASVRTNRVRHLELNDTKGHENDEKCNLKREEFPEII